MCLDHWFHIPQQLLGSVPSRTTESSWNSSKLETPSSSIHSRADERIVTVSYTQILHSKAEPWIMASHNSINQSHEFMLMKRIQMQKNKISFIWNSGTSKTNLWWQRSEEWWLLMGSWLRKGKRACWELEIFQVCTFIKTHQAVCLGFM